MTSFTDGIGGLNEGTGNLAEWSILFLEGLFWPTNEVLTDKSTP